MLVGGLFWIAETCLRFGFTVKSTSTVEKSDAMVFEQCSQSGAMSPQSMELHALSRSSAHSPPRRSESLVFCPKINMGEKNNGPVTFASESVWLFGCGVCKTDRLMCPIEIYISVIFFSCQDCNS